MALTQVTGPYPIFTDLDGSPLDDGYLYIGVSNQDPETNPIQVYWDSNLTIPATQPIRTNSGYAWRNGTPGLLYTAGEFSITIRNKRNEFVLYSPLGYGFDPAAVSASVTKNDFIGDGVETDFTLSASPSTVLATNVFINGVYQEKDSYTLAGNVITFSIAPPLSSSIEILTNETGVINSGNAADISYTLSKPGAVLQNVQTKLEQTISVKDFGAVGDGVADDTVAIQAAIDSVSPTGGSVVLPPGSYKISDQLNISSQNVFVQGSGRRATKIVQSNASKTVFNITAPYSALSSLSIEYASQGISGGSAIGLNAAFYSAIDDVYIYRAYIGIDFTNSSNSNQLTRVVCEDCTHVGISIFNSFNLMASTFQILNSSTALCSLGCIRIFGNSEGNNFMNGHTYQGAYSITTGATAYTMGQRPSYNKIHGVYLDASANGAVIDKAVEMDFIDCWFSARPGNGAYINQVDGIRFTGGGALNCDKNGVLVDTPAKRVVFKNFMSRSNSVAAANVYDGIVFGANTTDFVVQGCTLTNDTITFGTQRYGVNVLTGTSDRYVIADNLIGGNGTAGIFDGGTGVNKRVANNY